MSNGVIHLFDPVHGTGLIIEAGSGQEYPFQQANIQTGVGGARVVNAGQEVEFDIESGQAGKLAVNVRLPGMTPRSGPGVGGPGI